MKKTAVTVPAAGSVSEKEDISPSHLRWLVDSRTRNQNAALKLYTLLCQHKETVATKDFSAKTQHLLAACFSVWRAAFLADKDIKRSQVQAHARAFLGTMLAHNAIAYSQDRSSRNWTFNYYMNNATNELLDLSDDWPIIRDVLNRGPKSSKDTTPPQGRWNKAQAAFETAVECFERALQP